MRTTKTFPVTFELDRNDFIGIKRVIRIESIEFPLFIVSIKSVFIRYNGFVSVTARVSRYDENEHGKRVIQEIEGSCILK